MRTQQIDAIASTLTLCQNYFVKLNDSAMVQGVDADGTTVYRLFSSRAECGKLLECIGVVFKCEIMSDNSVHFFEPRQGCDGWNLYQDKAEIKWEDVVMPPEIAKKILATQIYDRIDRDYNFGNPIMKVMKVVTSKMRFLLAA